MSKFRGTFPYWELSKVFLLDVENPGHFHFLMLQPYLWNTFLKRVGKNTCIVITVSIK